MQKPVVTKGIVLSRTDFGEADRILTFLTPGGKMKAIAKGVRKARSKLAGGIEFFSVSDITYIVGKKEISTLISTRLASHYGNIVKSIEHTSTGYEIIKTISKATEDAAESNYFSLLIKSFESLNDLSMKPEITHLWFNMQLLKLSGHSPNLQTDIEGEKLSSSKNYNFFFDEMKFGHGNGEGNFEAKHIKFLRLGFQAESPKLLGRVEGGEKLLAHVQPLSTSMLRQYVRF